MPLHRSRRRAWPTPEPPRCWTNVFRLERRSLGDGSTGLGHTRRWTDGPVPYGFPDVRAGHGDEFSDHESGSLALVGPSFRLVDRARSRRVHRRVAVARVPLDAP